MEASRKLAFQGNSATFGVQTRVRFGLQILAPSSADADLVDVAAVGGLVDFRRLRASAAWPLICISSYTGAADRGGARPEPLGDDGDDLPLLRAFCSAPLPEIRAVPEPGGVVYELAEGPVGDTAASTCVFGWWSRGLGSVRGGAVGSIAEFMLTTETPAETLVFDLLVHRDLPFRGSPSARVWSSMHGRPRYPLAVHARYELPLSEGITDLGPKGAAAQHPLLPSYGALVETACTRAGWRPEDFRAYRLTMRFPPIPAVVTLTYPLLPPH